MSEATVTIDIPEIEKPETIEAPEPIIIVQEEAATVALETGLELGAVVEAVETLKGQFAMLNEKIEAMRVAEIVEEVSEAIEEAVEIREEESIPEIEEVSELEEIEIVEEVPAVTEEVKQRKRFFV
jgi:hypothetical protein